MHARFWVYIWTRYEDEKYLGVGWIICIFVWLTQLSNKNLLNVTNIPFKT